VDAEQQHFGAALSSGPITRIVKGKGTAVTVYSKYCFQLTNNALRGIDAAACDRTLQCCNPNSIKLAAVYIATDPQCSSNKKAAAVFKKTTWTLDGKKTSGVVDAKTLEFKIAFKSWSAPSSNLCFETIGELLVGVGGKGALTLLLEANTLRNYSPHHGASDKF